MKSLRRRLFYWTYDHHALHPTQIIVIGYALLILGGALLLTLPVATRDAGGAPFFTALFTATSASCVTGLVVADTFTYWSLFGQIVLLILIQIGGLGFITVITLASFMMHRNIGLQERLLMIHSFNLNDLTGVVRLVRHVLFGTLLIEGAGAVILASRFIPAFGFVTGSYYGLFHAVSSFCNAGFDLMGRIQPHASLAPWTGDPVVMATIPLLLIAGELGFFVWEDFIHYRKRKRLHAHTKLVLLITALLLGAGTVFFVVMEWNNPGTFGSLPAGEKLASAFFQSTALRTAGYSITDQAALTGASKFFSMFLMFIGGSPGSTAGGIKTVTLGILLLSALSAIRGQSQIHVFGRGIPLRQIFLALSTAIVMACVLFLSVIAISILEPDIRLIDVLFEATSAIGTVGVSPGITPLLGTGAKLILILLMFFGRVGLITLGFAVMTRPKRQNSIRYPESKLIIG